MDTSTPLTFELTDDKGRFFIVTFDTESPTRSRLQSIQYHGLPVCTIDLRIYDPQLYKDITNLMKITAENHWSLKTIVS